MRWGVPILLVAGLAGVSLAARAADETMSLRQALVAARTGLTLRNGHFDGDGAQALTAAIAQSRYVALGEDHLTHEIPQFAAAVCDAMAPQGLAAMAVEIGPQVSALVAPRLAGGTASAAIAALIHQYPDSVAFLTMRDEVDLATHCARDAGPAFKFWGLDQEFFGAAGWLLDLVMQQHDAQAASRTGDPMKLFLLQANDRELAQTEAILKAGGAPAAALSIFHELVVSHAIYASHRTHRDESNHARALLLKQTFLHDLQSLGGAAPPPRVLLKFGEGHLYKGVNPLEQRDLGNFVAELADGEGATSLHIATLGIRGVHRLYAGYGNRTRLAPFVLDQDDDYAWLKPAVEALMPSGWTLIDLRHLRFRKLSGAGPEWERMIGGYDFLVLMPEITPADPL
jgi:hypothetical protein